MPINFFINNCTTSLNDKLFGICDDISQPYAYTSIINSNKWIAIVENKNGHDITFIAIDHCLGLKKPNGHIDSSCDAMLAYDNNQKIVFIELKERNGKPKKWIDDGEAQLKNTIIHFIQNGNNLSTFNSKKAYLANNKHPKFRSSMKERMNKFHKETGVLFIIKNKIELD